MSWLRRKPKVKVVNIDPRQLLRATLYDSGAPHAEQISTMFGIPPASEEGEIHERGTSSKRVSCIGTLMPLLNTQAMWVSTAWAYEATDHQLDLDNPEHAELLGAYMVIAISAITGSLSTLFDKEILVMGGPTDE